MAYYIFFVLIFVCVLYLDLVEKILFVFCSHEVILFLSKYLNKMTHVIGYFTQKLERLYLIDQIQSRPSWRVPRLSSQAMSRHVEAWHLLWLYGQRIQIKHYGKEFEFENLLYQNYLLKTILWQDSGSRCHNVA